MPIWHWGLFVAGVHVSISSVFSLMIYRPSEHTGTVIFKIDADTVHLMFSSQLIYLRGVNSYAKVNKEEGRGNRKKGELGEYLLPFNLQTTQEEKEGSFYHQLQ